MLSAFSQAWASWKSAPGVALLAIVAFAIGIGSATAIFTVINGTLLRPVPYPNGDRFVALYGARTNEPDSYSSLSVQEAQQYRDETTSFDAFGWFRGGRFNLTAPGEPQFVPGVEVTPSLAHELGQPLMGQWFVDANSTVIAASLWHRLGSPRDIIGSGITLDSRRYTVTGVMRPGFEFPVAYTAMTAGDTEVWIPLDPSPVNPNPNSRANFTYARRKPGVSVAQAEADARRVAARIAAANPSQYSFYTAKVMTLRQQGLTNLQATLLTLLAGSGLLLLIGCANVATLLLARSVVRARETAIRVALGASRRQLAMRYFAEGALVSIAGAVAGIGLSILSVRQILIVAADFISRAEDIAIDWKVLGFSVAVAIVTGVLAGMAPLWQASRTAPNAVLTDGVRASAAAPARRLSQAFVIAEIALAFTLLTASVILIVHLQNLGHVSLGFDPNNLLTFELTLPRPAPSASASERNEQRQRGRAEQLRLIDDLRAIPGVTDVTYANQLPTFPGCLGSSFRLDDRPADALAERACIVATNPDYIQTMRIPLRAGRFLTRSDDDREDDPVPAALNETAARKFWPGRSAIGARGRFPGARGSQFEVIGVVGDVRNNGLNKPPEPEIYFAAAVVGANPMSVIVRSTLTTAQLVPAVRQTIRQINPTLALTDVATMNEVNRGTLQLERLSSIVMTFFGLAALLLATLGIYGVMSYFVRQRTVELGTRMALGAVNRDLVNLVLGGGLRLALTGLAIGSLALVGAVRLLAMLLDVHDIGWLPFASSAAVIALVTTAAASVPAWRTTFLSPLVAMRDQPPSAWRWASQRIRQTVRDIREVVSAESQPGISPADVLTAFVDAARRAESYTSALQAVLSSVCEELRVDSAALLEAGDGSPARYECVAAVGAMDANTLKIISDGFLITRLRAYPFLLPFTSEEFAGLAAWAETHRPDRLGEIRALAMAGVRLAVPLRTRQEMLGVLLLGARTSHSSFSVNEKQVLRVAADEFALMIENARLTNRVVEQETLRRDIALASDVQRRLLPDAPPQAANVQFAAASLPARRIGGDYYDFVELPDGGIGVALADVSGKGVAAALIMAVVQASLRIISSEGDMPLPRLVARMNQFIHRSTPASKYATFFYARLDQHARQLRYVNAGHNPPSLLRARQRQPDDATPNAIEELSVGGTVVGMFPEMTYEEGTVELYPGDVLLAFTDGVPEAHNPDNEEFGEARLQELLRATAHLGAGEISTRITAAMKNWIGEAEQYDDLTFIVMKVN